MRATKAVAFLSGWVLTAGLCVVVGVAIGETSARDVSTEDLERLIFAAEKAEADAVAKVESSLRREAIMRAEVAECAAQVRAMREALGEIGEKFP